MSLISVALLTVGLGVAEPPKDYRDACTFGYYLMEERIDRYLPDDVAGKSAVACKEEWPKIKDHGQDLIRMGCQAGIDAVMSEHMLMATPEAQQEWVEKCIQITREDQLK